LSLLLVSCGGGSSGGAGGVGSPGGGGSPTYTIGGTVSGLAGPGLVLQNNGGDNISLSADGPFAFSASIGDGRSYSVTVLSQPPSRICTLGGGSGVVASANVTSVAVTCVPGGGPSPPHTLGGTVSGLAGPGLVLQDNGGDDLALSADGPFVFAASVADGSSYSVTVLSQPATRTCTVGGGSGTVAGANVTSVTITCLVTSAPSAPVVSLGFGLKELQFSWPTVAGADFYRLLENPDGVSGFAEVATNIAASSYNHGIPVHLRASASYIVAACNVVGCTASTPKTLGASLVQAIGYVKASNTGASDEFGFAVALSADGNTLAVGAIEESSALTGVTAASPNEAATGNGALHSGAVYVFARSGGVWSQQGYLKASNTGINDQFGSSLALSADGNALAVGAYTEDGALTGVEAGSPSATTTGRGATDAGAVYVFVRGGTTWSQQAYVKASNTGANDVFGVSIALSGDGDTLAIGAPAESGASIGVTPGAPDDVATGNGASGSGAVYVLIRSGGTWSQQAYVKASNTETGDQFGTSVALSSDGNTLAVGARLEDGGSTGVIAGSPDETVTGNAVTNAGAAYVFTRSGTTWSQQAYLKASNTGPSFFNDEFGQSIALSGDGNTLAVGAYLESSPLTGIIAGSPDNSVTGHTTVNVNLGAVYVFTRIGATWSQQAYVKSSNLGIGYFGIQVALTGDGNTLAVGATGEAGGSSGVIAGAPDATATGVAIPSAGAVYVFTRSGATWSQRSYVKASNTTGDFFFGSSVALSGDGNTLAVGAEGENGASTGIGGPSNTSAPLAGAAYLY